MIDHEQLAILGPYIELYKVLKLADLAASGGEAKHLITGGLVRVNGEVESRKRRKIRPGDRITLQDRTIRITGSPLP